MECLKSISNNLLAVVYFTLSILSTCTCDLETCDRRPFDTQTAPLPPDNRFYIDIDGINDLYIPGVQYTVRLLSKDNKSTFIGYSIGLKEDETYNEKNPRRPKRLKPGRLQPSPDSHEGKTRPHCNNTVIHSDITPKTSAKALWIAPEKGSQCVTIYAIVAIKPDVWYNFEGPLSKRVCEDSRNAEDILPTQNDNCQVCEEARYQLTFEGMWSYNTHPNMFPKSQELARFSEVVGASHSKYFSVYKYNAEASAGMKMLAEQGNTTQLEIEIQSELGRGVRTVLKASAPPKTNLTTVTSFRANKENHLVSLVTGILPSPDWFLGLANLELCEFKSGQWAKTVKLNLYPLDAGTDSGKTFESSNDETSPPQPISAADIAKDGKVKAFARVIVDLIRTYPNPNCSFDTSTGSYDGEPDEGEETDSKYKDYEPSQSSFPYTTTPKSDEPITPDPESSERCPMTAWEDWPCEGVCENGTLTGIRLRYRYHIVDGEVVGKYSTSSEEKNIPRYCLNEETFQTQDCEEECEDDELPEDETEEPTER